MRPGVVAPRLRKAVEGKIDEVIPAPVYKKAEVEDKCTTLTLYFKGDYAVEFRAYDEAAAYRFVSTRKGDYTVKDEVAEFAFEGDNKVYCSYVRSNAKKTFEQQYYNSFENTYVEEPMSKMASNRLMFLPVLVDLGDRKVCITETDLMSYPGMYLYNPGRRARRSRATTPPCPTRLSRAATTCFRARCRRASPISPR